MTTRVRVFDGALDREVEGLVDRCLDAGVDAAQRLVPVDTGALQDDIDIVQAATSSGAEVVGTYGVTGAGTDYGLYVEYGTATGPEQPYLRPSVDAVLQEARR